jgi:hypothetical protein
MSETLSGADVGTRRVESERDEKMPLGNAKSCTNLRDTPRSAPQNCTFLTLAISGNFARGSTPSVPFPINPAPLPAKEAPGAKNCKIPQTAFFGACETSRN